MPVGEKRENLYASYAAEESFRAETVLRERERKKNRAAREIDKEVSSVHKMSIFHAKEIDKPSWYYILFGICIDSIQLVIG